MNNILTKNLLKQKGGIMPPFYSKFLPLILILVISLSLFSACNILDEEEGEIQITDFTNKTLYFNETPSKVVILQASLASVWKLAGGSYVGISNDYESYGLTLDDAEIIGSTKSPSLEKIVSLSPDLVIYSSKITGQQAAADVLNNMKIKTFSAEINDFEDYLLCLNKFTSLTGREDLYKLNGLDVQANINNIISKVPTGDKTSVLFVRCKSSGLDIIGRDNIACDMLENLNTTNIAKNEIDSIVKIDSANLNTSMEFVIKSDPQFIFFVYMGAQDVSVTEKFISSTLEEDAWKNLTAVKTKNYFVLDSKLFHYKPNERWAESYQVLFDILYGEKD